MMDKNPQFLIMNQIELFLFGGKGGVGKTTSATSTALFIALQNQKDKFLLASTDPAHSVGHSFGGSSLPSNLEFIEVNAGQCLADFKKRHSEKLREIATRGTFLDDGDISRFLDLSLPGMDELMAFLEISRWVEEKNYRSILVDTAPTGHTLRLLTVPELMEKWLQAMDALLGKHRYMKKLYGGTYKLDELDHFLLDLNLSVKKMKDLLQDSERCRFVVVALAERVVLRETLELVKKLKALKIPSEEIVINRLYLNENCSLCHFRAKSQREELLPFIHSLPSHSLWGVPLYPEEMRGIETLLSFWGGVSQLSEFEIQKSSNRISQSHIEEPETPTPVETLPPLPSAHLEFLLFAGKGGVGKTTLACATALRLAREGKNRKILLFSTDPAHSLSDCLNLEIGPAPTSVTPGLKAMEIDADAEFENLKREYEGELGDFLSSLLPGLDLSFDREVMEKLMDLAPPGLDEVMALMRAMESLTSGVYDLLIMDSAPTGHLLRLLEMPEVIDQWLKTFFGIFLKYKRVFRLPQISQRMVEMSKNLKILEKVLSHPEKSALYGVSILTQMALDESINLIHSCEKMSIYLPLLFLNQATPMSECFLCSAHHQEEGRMVQKFHDAFPKQHLSLVYWQGSLKGVEQLEELGFKLYQAEKVKITGEKDGE